ncbi:MAG: CPBP family intramembrane metalloprotease [Candidatus Kapabacteria bacterium]|jgi:hypothetical protein|nr:CPBP family intramembrane metalloprotease [Candidatus Kapabacteria bacterium]
MNQSPDNPFVPHSERPESLPNSGEDVVRPAGIDGQMSRNADIQSNDEQKQEPPNPPLNQEPFHETPPNDAPETAPVSEIDVPNQESVLLNQESVLPNIEENIAAASAEAEPFAHAKYGFAAVVTIFLMYQFAGGALHSLARNHSEAFETVLQGLGQILFMLIPAVLVMRYSPLKVQGLIRSGGEVNALQWVLGLVGIFGIQIFDAGFIAVQERIVPSFLIPVYQQLRMWSDMVEQFYRTSFAGTTPFEAVRALVIGAVVPAFAEEVLFRGVLQRSLEEMYPVRRAIIVTAMIFGILHFNPLSVLPLILIGAYLGFLAYYTQSLALPIVAHFLSNAIAIVALYAPGQGLEMSPYGFSLGRGVLLLAFGAMLILGALMLIVRLTPQTPKAHLMPSSSIPPVVK